MNVWFEKGGAITLFNRFAKVHVYQIQSIQGEKMMEKKMNAVNKSTG